MGLGGNHCVSASAHRRAHNKYHMYVCIPQCLFYLLMNSTAIHTRTWWTKSTASIKNVVGKRPGSFGSKPVSFDFGELIFPYYLMHQLNTKYIYIYRIVPMPKSILSYGILPSSIICRLTRKQINSPLVLG